MPENERCVVKRSAPCGLSRRKSFFTRGAGYAFPLGKCRTVHHALPLEKIAVREYNSEGAARIMKTRKIIAIGSIRPLLDEGENFLSRADIRIIPASSNEEVLELHRKEKADLIIAELDGHAMSGELLCSAIREGRDIRSVSLIIVHSGGDPDTGRLQGCRANAFVEKSPDPRVLIETARKLLSVQVRETYRAPVLVRVRYSTRSKFAIGYSENISATGMLFVAEEPLSIGETILCSFILPGAWRIRTRAEIVRHVDSGAEHSVNQYGVRFVDLADKHRSAIEAYIKKRQQRD